MTIELAFGILASISNPFPVWMQKHGIETRGRRGALGALQVQPW
jgi:hypothetical protein